MAFQDRLDILSLRSRKFTDRFKIYHTISRLLTTERREVEQKWKLTPTLAVQVFLVPFVVVLIFSILYFLNKPFLRFLTKEDGLIEWLQVIGFIIGLLFSLLISNHLFKDSRRIAGIFYLFAAAGLIFIAGEEIAWGQRIFNFITPADLAAINDKSEVSLHNISSIAPLFTVGKLLVGVLGVFGHWILKWLNRYLNTSSLELYVIPLFLSSAFMVILAQRILRLTVLQDTVPLGYSEIEEIFLAYGIATFTFFIWRRVSR